MGAKKVLLRLFYTLFLAGMVASTKAWLWSVIYRCVLTVGASYFGLILPHIPYMFFLAVVSVVASLIKVKDEDIKYHADNDAEWEEVVYKIWKKIKLNMIYVFIILTIMLFV